MDDVERTTLRKLTLRIISIAMLLYFLNWLDRVNVGFAALQMNEDLKFTASVYGLGAGIFFLGFTLFEIPSNLVLHRIGARPWIARIMITWGLVCCLMALTQGVASFYSLRFLLGVAEAGFTPGLVLYFSFWFPARHRAKAFALLFASPLLAPIFGGPLSGLILTGMNGVADLAGWKWVFILEGLPTILVGVFVLFYLPDSPAKARWLTEAERSWLVSTLAAEQRAQPGVTHGSVASFLGDKHLWTLVAIYFCWVFSSYGIVFWLPLIIKNATGFGPLVVGLLNSVPFLFAVAGLLLVGGNSDRTGERKMHIVIFAFLTTAALIATALVSSPVLGFILICIAAFCIWAQQAVFWTLPSTYLTGRSAAAGVALVNMGAGLGGFLGPPGVGFIKDATGSFAPGLLALAVPAVCVAFIVMAMPLERRRPVPLAEAPRPT